MARLLRTLEERQQQDESSKRPLLWFDNFDNDFSNVEVVDRLVSIIASIDNVQYVIFANGQDETEANAEGRDRCIRAFGVVRGLKTFELMTCCVTANRARAISDLLRDNTDVENLSIKRTTLSDEVVEILCEGIRLNKGLKCVAFENTKLDGNHARDIVAATTNHPTVRELALPTNNIGDTGAFAVAAALVGKCLLEKLELQSNNIGIRGAKSIAEALKKNRTLLSIDLEDNKMGEDGVMLILQGLKMNSSLLFLHISRNAIGENGVNALAKILQTRGGLKGIRLGDLDGKAIQVPPIHLEYLKLSDNALGCDGAVALAAALKGNTHLKTLYIDGCNIGHIGLQALVEWQHSKDASLQTLNLSRNPLGNDCAQCIAALLQNNRSVTHLFLQEVGLSAADMQTLVRPIQTNSSLELLYLCHNWFGDEGALLLAEGLRRNLHLLQILLTYNEFTEVGRGSLELASAQSYTSRILFLFLVKKDSLPSDLIRKLVTFLPVPDDSRDDSSGTCICMIG